MLCACSSRPIGSAQDHLASGGERTRRVELEMDPLLIQAGSGETLSPMELFHEGVGGLQAQEYGRCIERLGALLRHFPEHRSALYARYNLGLCYELSGRYQEAVEVFDDYVETLRLPEHRGADDQELDLLDGQFRLGFNLTKASQPERAIALYERLLTTTPIIGFDRAECHLRRAIAQLLLGRFALADRDLSLAISHINGSIGAQREGNELLAEVHFYRGELYRRHMKHIKLKMPVKRMKRLFADKILFFRKSLYAYVDCLNVRQVYWGIAGGHQLGKLHEELYEAILWAETPADFDPETEAYYLFELEKKLAPLLKESISLYEKTMTLSVTHGLNNEWVTSTQDGLSRLRDLEESVQRRLSLDPLAAHEQRRPLDRLMGPPAPSPDAVSPQAETASARE